MDPEVLEYLKSQPTCVFAIEMMDGAPHGATVHFAYNENPFMFFFVTDRKYRKSQALLGREVSRATLVIGTDEANMKTFQADGGARVLKGDEGQLFKETYFAKFPKKQEAIMADHDSLFFVFIPTWWRFTDFTRKEGKLVLSSQ
jgi:uncharacterized protein YhbP (UPF0306 family)